MKRFMKIFMLITILPLAVHAQDQDCTGTDQSQLALNICSQNFYQKVDAELNVLFHEASQRIGDDVDTHNLLRNAERAWVAFRDAECNFSTSKVVGGSAYAMIYNMCLIELTQKRIEEFEKYLNCEEGDLSCPLQGSDS